MRASRRRFLKTSMAGAGALLGGIRSGNAEPAFGSLSFEARAVLQNVEPSTTNVAAPTPSAIYNLPPGEYPGNPLENFSPSWAIDSTTYRNLALHRPATHSSSYDYNLTAQLVTDGIKHSSMPRWVATAESFSGLLPKNQREFFLDHNPTSVVTVVGSRPYVEIVLGGGKRVPQVDRVDVLFVAPPDVKTEDLALAVSTSEDGRVWESRGRVAGPESVSISGYPLGFARPGRLFHPSIPLSPLSTSRRYRVELEALHAPAFSFGLEWQVGEVAFFRGTKRVEVGGPYDFTSAWMSEGLDEEWVYVDLGAGCEFDRVKLYWIAPPAEGRLQVSDDAERWQDLQRLPRRSRGAASAPMGPQVSLAGRTDDITLSSEARGRYVRVLMTRPSSPHGYILSELEVYGRGGPVPKPAPSPLAGGELNLARGAWRLQRDSLVGGDGETLSKPGYRDDAWTIATVPGTVLSSYLNIGALPDPNYGDNQLMVSDSFFYSDFWYRTEFDAPSLRRGQRAWLNFAGINWKAQVYVSGRSVGRIEGGFMRGRFDVTEHLVSGGQNALAVRVEKNDTPGSVKQKTFEAVGKNGGALGVDNPTFHASIGWDWIPTIRGRNTGLWDSVTLALTGPVTIERPFVTTRIPLPDASVADVTIEVTLINHAAERATGTLRGKLGEHSFQTHVSLDGMAKQTLKLSPSTHPALRVRNPKLWWPNGYGEPHLYDFTLTLDLDGFGVSDTKKFPVGLRQVSYSEEGEALRIRVNGRRLVPRGGNWGFSESMLRYRSREFDAAVRYHREMNFTMIRNWVGQTGSDEFYDACDRHGVMVWQDFWLANPWDGPDPKDDALFLSNARDSILRLRNHPCMALYCGRNEGEPPPQLEAGIIRALAELHPGIQYIPNSAEGVVSGHGPYMAMPRTFYFTEGSARNLHSEMGMPNIPTIDSVRAMMPEAARWPQGLDWGLHDFCLDGAQNGSEYRRIIEYNYGGAHSVDEWVSLAQFVNYDGYRAMFEGQSKHRMGLLLWMSHPCWPSFVWQTYDYYLEPTAAYFGCKKACEPLHVQWNPATDDVEVVNISAGSVHGLMAQAQILNMDGRTKWQKTASLNSAEDSVETCIRMEYPADLSSVHFVKLALSLRGRVVSSNFYLRGRQEGNYRAIRELAKASLQASTRRELRGAEWRLTTELYNASPFPALMVRLKPVRERTGDRILPAIFSDNYVALMPGERAELQTRLFNADTRGENPRIVVEGFNAGRVTEESTAESENPAQAVTAAASC